jgi:LPXTG-motif cell wall-anchored protein
MRGLRAVMAGLAVLAGLVSAAPASAAAAGPQPFIGSRPADGPPAYTYVAVDRAEAAGRGLWFGVVPRTGDPALPATMTIPHYPGMSIATTTAGCAAQGESVICSGPLVGDTMWGGASILVTSATPLGYAGDVTVSTPGAASVSMPLWVIDEVAGADMEFDPTDTVAQPGQTVTVTVTVINHGPSMQPFWAIGYIDLPEAQLVGQSGCSPGVVSGNTWQCVHPDVMPVGAAITVTFDIKIFGLKAEGALFGYATVTYLTDPNPWNNSLSFNVVEYRAGAPPAPVDDPAPVAGPAPVAAARPSAAPTSTDPAPATPSAGPLADQPAAARPVHHSTGAVWWVLAGAFVVVAAGGFVAYRRRNRARVAR